MATKYLKDRPRSSINNQLRVSFLNQKGPRYFPIRMVLGPVQDTNPERIGTPVSSRMGLFKMATHWGVLRFIERIPDVLIKS